MIAKEIQDNLKGGSMIRKMFEEGARLRALHGAENVYDFSIGNPDGEPPQAFTEALIRLARQPGIHHYMPNPGYEDVRARVAAYENRRTGLKLGAGHVVMTVGAAGGMNTAFRALLDPGSEVIVLAPYFVEYLFYIRNYRGVPVVVPCDERTFLPDSEAIAAAITPRTRAIILNTPNNPTGVVYPRESLLALRDVLNAAQTRYGNPIYVLSDEPYTAIAFEGAPAPVLSVFDNGITINSFSKSLALPGDRIGYLAVNPAAHGAEELMAALAFASRTLGYVNAPGLFQKAVAECLDLPYDPSAYRQRRDVLYDCLTQCGMECVRPQGAFYLFPKVPGGDDLAFCERAAQKNILVVPGRGFGWPGHIRIAYCVGLDTIHRSLPAWQALLA